MPETYDVVICGGGLAGLSLARHLSLYCPERSVLLLDRMSRPLEPITHKVGESTTEAGAYYLSQVLQLPHYFEDNHVRKNAFRFFFGPPGADFAERPEFGISRKPAVKSYNFERGSLENHYRGLVDDSDVTMLEGTLIKAMRLGEGDKLHQVAYENIESGELCEVAARWLIDATGRRRFLQKKMELGYIRLARCSAAWFRVPARIDVDDFVSQDNLHWHQRVPGGIRYGSTNHLMGTGYWVWLIPLASGATSVGIVALDEEHPLATYNTFERASAWLQEHEPHLAAQLKGIEPLDFKCMRRYSFTSKQVFSTDRWACLADAAVFPDPLYAPGIDFIALGNLLTVEMIRRDFAGKLTDEIVQQFDRTVVAQNDSMTADIQLGYPLFGKPNVMSAKVLWDTAAGWSLFAPQIFNPDLVIHHQANQNFRDIKGSYYFLTRKMQQLFVEWAEREGGTLAFEFIDFLSLPFMRDIRDRNLVPGKSLSELQADQALNSALFEQLAVTIFLLAVEDVCPAELNRVRQAEYINPRRVSLRPQDWEKDGLFDGAIKIDYRGTYQQMRELYSTTERVGQ